MNFILEFIPKKENEKELAIVVRAQNGFPLSVFDDLNSAKDFIADKVKTALESKGSDN